MTDAAVQVVSTRPTPGTPRPYDFPDVERTRLANGLSLIVANLPGRPLVSRQQNWIFAPGLRASYNHPAMPSSSRVT